MCLVQDDIVREAQTMRLLNHPNVLALYVSFVHKENLWMIEPYISGGSMLNVMKYAHPDVSPRPHCTSQRTAVLPVALPQV